MYWKLYGVLLLSLSVSTNGLQISTQQGDIIGVERMTIEGRPVEAYLGIPFAKPPIGNLRFANPEPFGKWTGVWDGTKDGQICLQNGWILGVNGTIGGEDCLYLNVYTPSVKSASYPVMVFIHGGGFITGNGGQLFYKPDALLDKDIVLVSINYRLNVLGFISTDDNVIPGNFGLKDQVIALKWVQENIAAYGGDAGSVTIFGHSAGGASVHYLTLSPLTKGLIHRAIPMSGTAYCPWAMRYSGIVAKNTKKLASFYNCNIDSSKQILDCLRKLPAEKFVNSLPKFEAWDRDPLIPFSPVVEPSGGKEAFLTKHPTEIKTTLPLMSGITTDEGLFRMILFELDKSTDIIIEDMNRHFDEIAPITLFYDDTASNPAAVAKKIRKFYFSDKKIDKTLLNNVTKMYSDGWFVNGVLTALQSHNGPSYLYLFNHKGKHSTIDVIPNGQQLNGICHGDELQYLFPQMRYLTLLQDMVVDTNDRQMINKMVTLWTNFAIYGTPTPEGSEVMWTMSMPDFSYLNIQYQKTEMQRKLYVESYQFWKNLQWNDKFSSAETCKSEL